MKVNELDQQLIDLLSARIKASDEYPLEDMASYCDVLGRSGDLSVAAIKAIWRELKSAAVASKKVQTVAFFGLFSSFTHCAAVSRFGSSVKYLPKGSIADVFAAVESGEADFGVVPVENSTEGAVNGTLDSLMDSEAQLVGEIKLRVHHNLLSKYELSEIKTVYSHPQALAQCRQWLKSNLPEAILIESGNTTYGVELAKSTNHSAAIASISAASDFDIPVRCKNIEDLKGNTTRFSIISNAPLKPTGNDKTSLLVCTKDKAGALYDALGPFKKYGVSLTMIESRPSKRQSWEYFFFIDFIGHISDAISEKLLDDLSSHCQFVKVLGSYPLADS